MRCPLWLLPRPSWVSPPSLSPMRQMSRTERQLLHTTRAHWQPAAYPAFDTYKLVQRMEMEGGMTRDGAEGVLQSVSEVMADSVAGLATTSVSAAEFEKSIYVNSVDFNHLRNEMTLMEQSEVALMRGEVARLEAEAAKLRMRMGEEMRRVTSSVRLELGMEKGRVRDLQGYVPWCCLWVGGFGDASSSSHPLASAHARHCPPRLHPHQSARTQD